MLGRIIGTLTIAITTTIESYTNNRKIAEQLKNSTTPKLDRLPSSTSSSIAPKKPRLPVRPTSTQDYPPHKQIDFEYLLEKLKDPKTDLNMFKTTLETLKTKPLSPEQFEKFSTLKTALLDSLENENVSCKSSLGQFNQNIRQISKDIKKQKTIIEQKVGNLNNHKKRLTHLIGGNPKKAEVDSQNSAVESREFILKIFENTLDSKITEMNYYQRNKTTLSSKLASLKDKLTLLKDTKLEGRSRASSPSPSRASSSAPSRASSPAPSRASSPAPSRASSPVPSGASSPVPSRASSSASSRASSSASSAKRTTPQKVNLLNEDINNYLDSISFSRNINIFSTEDPGESKASLLESFKQLSVVEKQLLSTLLDDKLNELSKHQVDNLLAIDYQLKKQELTELVKLLNDNYTPVLSLIAESESKSANDSLSIFRWGYQSSPGFDIDSIYDKFSKETSEEKIETLNRLLANKTYENLANKLLDKHFNFTQANPLPAYIKLYSLDKAIESQNNEKFGQLKLRLSSKFTEFDSHHINFVNAFKIFIKDASLNQIQILEKMNNEEYFESSNQPEINRLLQTLQTSLIGRLNKKLNDKGVSYFGNPPSSIKGG